MTRRGAFAAGGLVGVWVFDRALRSMSDEQLEAWYRELVRRKIRARPSSLDHPGTRQEKVDALREALRSYRHQHAEEN